MEPGVRGSLQRVAPCPGRIRRGQGGHLRLLALLVARVGFAFEHEPRTDEQKAAIADAVAALEDGSTLFELTGAAECSLAETDVELETDDDDHSDHDHHSDHDDHDGDEQHSEFEAEYAFECDNAGKLAKIRVGLFDRFPLTTEVEVSYVGEGFQTFKSLTAADPVLTVEP